MTIEQFLIDTYKKKLWKDVKKYNEAVDDATTLSPDTWNKKWSEYLMSNEYLVPSYKESKLEETTKPLPVRLRNYFGEDKFNPNDVKKNYIRQTFFDDVPKEEFERVLSSMKDNYDYEVNLREQESDKIRRQMEVEGKWIRNPERNWSTLDRLLSSDYEKQRYIDDPKSAIFGYESPGFMGSSAGAKADLISGLGAGAVDLVTSPIPIVNAIGGPAIRAGRDVAHKVSDSPYQKEWGDIGKDFGTDVAFNAGTTALANARRASRILSSTVSPEVKSAFELSLETDAIKKGLTSLPTPSNSKEFAYAVRTMPDSRLKQDLISTFDKNGKLVDDKAAEEIIKKYSRDVKDIWQSANELVMTGTPGKLPPHTSFMEQVLTTPKPTGIRQGGEMLALRGMNKVNLGWPGTMAFESVRTAAGRGSNPQTVMNQERTIDFEREKNAYRANNEVNWERFGDSFKPSKIEGSPAWAAYEEWYFDKYGKYPEDK